MPGLLIMARMPAESFAACPVLWEHRAASPPPPCSKPSQAMQSNSTPAACNCIGAVISNARRRWCAVVRHHDSQLFGACSAWKIQSVRLIASIR